MEIVGLTVQPISQALEISSVTINTRDVKPRGGGWEKICFFLVAFFSPGKIEQRKKKKRKGKENMIIDFYLT